MKTDSFFVNLENFQKAYLEFICRTVLGNSNGLCDGKHGFLWLLVETAVDESDHNNQDKQSQREEPKQLQ